MEPHPPAAVPEPPLPWGPRQDGPEPEPEPELELELEPVFWAPEAAEPAPGPPPWSPPERGGCPALEEPVEPPARPEEEPRLRPVFDALDRDGDGFVRVEEFVQFATAYGAEQSSVPPGKEPWALGASRAMASLPWTPQLVPGVGSPHAGPLVVTHVPKG